MTGYFLPPPRMSCPQGREMSRQSGCRQVPQREIRTAQVGAVLKMPESGAPLIVAPRSVLPCSTLPAANLTGGTA